jgi:hypothetical protein
MRVRLSKARIQLLWDLGVVMALSMCEIVTHTNVQNVETDNRLDMKKFAIYLENHWNKLDMNKMFDV